MVWARVGAIFMFLGVGLGAFGAHALQRRLSPEMLAIFETGVRYHFVHALGLFVVAWLSAKHPGTLLTGAGWSLTLGILLFSGSLYVLSVSGIRWLGAITPLGGTLFLVGWVLIALAAASGE